MAKTKYYTSLGIIEADPMSDDPAEIAKMIEIENLHDQSCEDVHFDRLENEPRKR